MKILHINFAFVQGGIDNMMNDIMKCQLKHGHDVTLLIINDKTDEQVLSLLPEYIKVHLIKRPQSSKNPFYLLKIFFLIQFVIKPDIIHCHNENVVKFLRCDRHPRVLTVHAMNLPTSLYDRYNHIFCISRAVRNDVLRSYCSENVSVAYNGVDFSLVQTRADLGRNASVFNIAVVGRLNHMDKGQDIAINTVDILRRKYQDNVCLSIIGDGLSVSYLKNLVSDLSIDNYVNFLGSKKRDWVYNHLCEFDLVMVPSRHEGFGLTIVEAYAAGVPVIASNIDGPMEVLGNGAYGYIFESESPDSAAKVIHSIIKDENSSIVKTQQDRNIMLCNYSIDNTVSEYEEVYKKLVKHR